MGAALTLVLLPVLGSALLVAAMNPVQRVALVGKSSPTLYLSACYAAATAGFVGLYLLWWGLSAPQQLQNGFWRAAIAAGAINIGIQYLHAKALSYKQGEVSLVTLLSALTPGLVTLLALTLGEVPGWVGVAGIGCIVIGSWVLLSKEEPAHWWQWWVYLRPLQVLSLFLEYGSLDERDRERAKVVALGLGSAALSTFGLLAVGLYVRRAGDFQGMWVGITLNWAIVGAAFILLNLRRPLALLAEWHRQWGVFGLAAVGYAALLVGANYLEVPVFGETFVAYVGTLNRTRILFGVLLVWALAKLGSTLFREQHLKRRFVAAIVMLLGATLITSEGLPERLTDRFEIFGF